MKLEVDAKAFRNHLHAASLACRDPQRYDGMTPAQECVLLEANGEKQTLRFVATCGHWLWMSEFGAPHVSLHEVKNATTLIHLPFVKLMIKAKIGKNELATLHLADRRLDLISGERGWDDRSHLTFPPYRNVIPTTEGKTTNLIAMDPRYLAMIGEAFTRASGLSAKGPAPSIVLRSTGNMFHPIIASAHGVAALAVLALQKPESGHDPWRNSNYFRK